MAAVVLALSFATPFTLPGAPVAMILALLLMHVIAAVAITGVLTTLAAGDRGAGDGGRRSTQSGGGRPREARWNTRRT